MSAALSLYRRHRPRSFADVVGQEHVVRTLSNAIEQEKVHHAYLFVGSRGTGKTSMAKILAASLNCVNGATLTPCGVCESCRSIAEANSLDVIEMDAASNNSVDDIRDLREKVAFAPVLGRYKVYILDEAHMLTTAAWNAFLKTLEEPPPHTIFVLATTEANKVLPTVVDRCHRFDFVRPSVEQIASVLRRVTEAESIELPEAACALIARSATGSFRDALGTLEQLVAYAGKSIALEDVLAVLGVADADLLFGTIDAIASANAAEALRAAARLSESGRDVGRFFQDLEGHARALMIVQTLKANELPAELHISRDYDERLVEQARAVSPAMVVRLLDLIANAFRVMKDGADPRTQLELTLVKASVPEFEASTSALITRIERLETGRRPTGSPGDGFPDISVSKTNTSPAKEDLQSPPDDRSSPTEPSSPDEDLPELHKEISVTTTPTSSIAVGNTAVAVQLDPTPEPEIAIQAREIASEFTNPESTLDLTAFVSTWPAVVAAIQEESPMLAALLNDARPTALQRNQLTLTWAESAAFLKRKAEDPSNNEVVLRSIRKIVGSPLRVNYELCADGELPKAVSPQVSDEELIARFVAEFDAEELPPEPEEKQ